MAKRTLDSFFKPSTPKRPKVEPEPQQEPPSEHPNYPIPIPQLPTKISTSLITSTPSKPPRNITNQPHLDLQHFQPFIPRSTANELFQFLRASLPFYRVRYKAKRNNITTEINTPRWTTVFGIDSTSRFIDGEIFDSAGPTKSKYQCAPRPIPQCLDVLRKAVEIHAGEYNFCLVNYYAGGDDSIAFHSDDERFLGERPDIASLSLGGERDFVMKHKPSSDGSAGQIKMAMGSGDMVVMRGETQGNWLHSIPKRKNASGRINITFRKAIVPEGTNNYYHYNVGNGEVYRWDEVGREMVRTEKKEEVG